MKLKLMAALLALPLMATAGVAQQPATRQPAAQAPRLIVAISVDQFSSDLFNQYRQYFTGGLRRLSQGAAFPGGYQGHGATETCPGHSTILTGSRPARTGIIANEWYDLSSGREDKRVYCAEDPRVAGSSSSRYTVSPYHLRVPTLGDLMRRADPRSRSVAVAGKDRAAIMMGGHNPTQRWWRDGARFTSHAGVTPSPAVAGVNRDLARTFGQARPASPMLPLCEARAGVVPIEGGGGPVGDGRFAREADDNRSFQASPDADAVVLALALAMRQEMALGEGGAPDLLAVGLSATDYVGHRYGTQGAEMCLQLMALDRALGDFFAALDRTGVDYVVMLTADHGGMDIPERARQQGAAHAVRVDPALNPRNMGAAIGRQLGLTGELLYGDRYGASGDMYVSRALAPADRERVLAEALRSYRAHPHVAAVFTRAELERAPMPAGTPDAWSLLERARASFDAERSGDFVVLLRPQVSGIFDTGGGYIAGHGSPWDYDRRVPILFWRSGLAQFEQPLAVETADIMPTLAALIGLRIDPASIDGRCLDLIEGPETNCASPAPPPPGERG